MPPLLVFTFSAIIGLAVGYGVFRAANEHKPVAACVIAFVGMLAIAVIH